MSEILDTGLVEEVRSKVASVSSSSKKESEDTSSVSTAESVQVGQKHPATPSMRMPVCQRLLGTDVTPSPTVVSEHNVLDTGRNEPMTPPARLSSGCSLLLDDYLLSSDPADMSFMDQEDLNQSTSRLYTWDFLDGAGRVDSEVDNHWVYNEIKVGGDLMDDEDAVIPNNIKLVVCKERSRIMSGILFVMPLETLCCHSQMRPLQKLIYGHIDWSRTKLEAFVQLLDDSPPQNRSLKSVLTKIADTTQLWNTRMRNEDTYLKSQLGPFLDTYFGKLRYTKSDWTPTQDDTRGSESNLLIPDYATTTQVGKQQVSVVLLEGKIAKNAGRCQMWDDLTKLGQELKMALDSIQKLQPEDDVCVIGVLVREPLIEFYMMRIHAEATYIMHRFAATYIAPEAMNVFPLVRLMEVFEHAKAKVEQTVNQLRRVKVHASLNPKVPLSWLRPSFKKPKLCQIVDGQ
ncbi:hypothetical protein BGZ74_006226 [Mortierella antarctica]|nr:hypothetical protein BGZ74_006226 [Mortierella antarctica]